jgi:hypothetical protein
MSPGRDSPAPSALRAAHAEALPWQRSGRAVCDSRGLGARASADRTGDERQATAQARTTTCRGFRVAGLLAPVAIERRMCPSVWR